jgi:hypothetical protein
MRTKKILNWYENEIKRDAKELDNEKAQFINSIKKFDKQDILPEKPKKLSLWQRIMKVLIG